MFFPHIALWGFCFSVSVPPTFLLPPPLPPQQSSHHHIIEMTTITIIIIIITITIIIVITIKIMTIIITITIIIITLPARKPAQRFCVFWVAWRYSKKRKCAYCHGWCIGTWLWCVSIPLRTIPKCCFVEAKTIFHMFQWLENRPYFWTCFVFSMGKCTCFRTISSTQLAQLLRSACTHLMTLIHKTPLPCFAVRLDHRMTTSQAIGNHPFAGFPTRVDGTSVGQHFGNIAST